MRKNVIRLRLIDETNIGQHYHLEPGDTCLYLFEYTRSKGYSHSQTNNDIKNLKMPLDAHPERLRYKDAAISKFGSDLASALPEIFSEIGGSEKAAFVPVPPSASKSSPEYDNRLVRILKETGMCIHFCEINIREAVILNGDYMASHKSGNFRISLNELMGIMRFVEGQSLSDFEHIFIFDDVITAGTHYKAVKNILLRHGCAEKDIYGLFLARTIDPKDDD